MTWLYRVLVICALIGLLAPGYGAWAAHQQGIGETRATASYNAAIDRQKAQAGRLLTTETQKAATATKALHHSKVEREIDDAENARTVAALAGGAIPTPRLQNVGAVVVAPKAQIPPVPAAVQQTLPKPVGHFHQSFLNYFSSKPALPTKSISPTPAAGPTP